MQKPHLSKIRHLPITVVYPNYTGLSLGMPSGIYNQTPYNSDEIEAFLSFDQHKKITDPETDLDYFFFKKNYLQQPSLDELKALFLANFDHLRQEINKILGEELCDKAIPREFWRTLITINHPEPDSSSMQEKELAGKLDNFPGGSHYKTEQLDQKTVLRIKTATFQQLQEIVPKLIEELFEK